MRGDLAGAQPPPRPDVRPSAAVTSPAGGTSDAADDRDLSTTWRERVIDLRRLNP